MRQGKERKEGGGKRERTRNEQREKVGERGVSRGTVVSRCEFSIRFGVLFWVFFFLKHQQKLMTN